MLLSRFGDFADWPANGFSGLARSYGALDQLRREMDRLFYQPGAFEASGASPRFSVEDQGAHFVARAELPGLTEKDLELTVTGNTLTLKGSRKLTPPEGYSVHRGERGSFEFARSFELPTKVNADKVEAKLEHGVLTVTLPKAPEAQPKQIAVKAH